MAETFREAFMDVLVHENLRKADAARRLGITKQALNYRLSQQNIKSHIMQEMASGLGYDIVLDYKLIPKAKETE